MFSIVENMQADAVYIIADLRNDTEKIPTRYGVGSSCFVIEDSSLWMLGNDKKWHELLKKE